MVDGIKWIVDKEKNIVYKKNNPSITMTIDIAFETFPESTQEEILKFL